jgi:hypothetical protein
MSVRIRAFESASTFHCVSIGEDAVHGPGTHYISLIQDDHISKLDLIDHQVGNRAFVLGRHIVSSVGEKICGVKVIHHRERIDDCGCCVQPCEFL